MHIPPGQQLAEVGAVTRRCTVGRRCGAAVARTHPRWDGLLCPSSRSSPLSSDQHWHKCAGGVSSTQV